MAIPSEHPIERNNPEIVLRARIKQLEARIEALEVGTSVPVVAASPTGGRDGSLAGSVSPLRLWIRVNGTWRYTALT